MRSAAIVLSALAGFLGAAAHAQDRRAFEIAVGPVSGDLYVQGERLAGVVSHPPGLSRCAVAARCGPEGLIASARATASASEGLLAIARGEIASAFSPADVAAAMRLNAGKGKQNQSRLRAVGIVGEETLLVVAAAKGPVTTVRGLRGRWVGIGAHGSRTRIAATALLGASRISQDTIRASEASGAAALELLKQRKLDAFVWIGPNPPPGLSSLVKSGAARIVPIDKTTLARLTATRLGYSAKTIPEGQTASVPVVWLVDEKQQENVVFGVVRAAFDPLNAALLAPSPKDPSSVRLTRPPEGFPLPLHAGAARFFAEGAQPQN